MSLAARGAGWMVVLQAAGRTEESSAWLEAAFTVLRQEEWGEFLVLQNDYLAVVRDEGRLADQ